MAEASPEGLLANGLCVSDTQIMEAQSPHEEPLDQGMSSPAPGVPADYDSSWKEAIEQYFPDFMAFFFPEIRADIAWDQGYEFLDKSIGILNALFSPRGAGRSARPQERADRCTACGGGL